MSNRELAAQLLERVPESKLYYIIGVLEGAAIPDEITNADTLEAFREIDEMKASGTGQSFDNLDDLWKSLED